jgi:Tol biopolymer transport system component
MRIRLTPRLAVLRYLLILSLGWLFLLLLAACAGTFEMGVEQAATPDQPAIPKDLTLSPEQPQIPTPTPAAPLPGFVYRTDDGLWWVDGRGQPVQVLADNGEQGVPAISPDGSCVLYLEEERDEAESRQSVDLWLADLRTGERRNLTRTPDAAETNFRWWPARPDLVISSSRPREILPELGVTGFLAVVGTDGDGYRVLDDQNHTGGLPAPSPDGQTIAYGSGATAWLYHWDVGPEVFDPADYGLPSYRDTHIGSPSWSPDGGELAWIVRGDFAEDRDPQMGLAVFDLEAQTTRVLHLYDPAVRDGWPPPPVWSPDGQWLAVTAWAQHPDLAGVWVVRIDGQQEGASQSLFTEYHLGGSHPVWISNGSWLAFSRELEGEGTSAWAAQTGTWGLIRLDLPSDAYITGWLSPATESAPSVTPGAPQITSTPAPIPGTPGWNTYSNAAFGVSFQYPAHWQPGGDDRYAGEDGFVSVGAMGSRGASIDDVVASEAEHILLPYGSEPVIENLRIQDREARLILPSADANMGDQAALIVSFPEPVEMGDTVVQFLVLYADRDHIRAIAQTLRFAADSSVIGTVTPEEPIAWVNLPPGLVYSTREGLWLINADEQPVQIHDNPQAILSPDGIQLVTIQQDVWLLNLVEGSIQHLINTPDRTECCFRWWPERPDVLLFYSTEEGVEPGPGMVYRLSTIDVDGQGYRVLDTEHNTGTTSGPGEFAPSPDGQTIAYGSGSTGWLYHWDEGVRAFDPADYSLTGYGEIQIDQPAWSPDGARLAWIVKGGVAADGSSAWTGIGLFDLTARTAQVLHSHESQGVGWPAAPVWSPDGKWLAFGDGSPSDSAGLWIARADGKEEFHLGLGGNPVWSPDGKWLAFSGFSQDGLPAYLLAEVETWELRPLNVPYDRYGALVDWISP